MSQKVKASTEGQSIWVECESFSNRDYVALVPGAKWRADEGKWQLPLTWAAAKQLRNTFEEGLELDDTMVEWGFQEYQSRISPCMTLREVLNPGQPYPTGFDKKLYPYQTAGAMFLATAEKAILSDPVGAGKTATAISAAKYVNALPALVVAPKSTLISWQREIERWWPDTPVYVVNGTKKQRDEIILSCLDEPGIVVLNWEAVRLHSRLASYGSIRLRHCVNCDRTSENSLSKCERCPKELNEIPFRLIIADEIHRMSKTDSKWTRALWYLGNSPSVEYRWGLTGTPLTDQIDTIFPLLHFLDKEEWPSKIAFIDRYAQTRIVPWGSGVDVIGLNQANEEEFQEIFQPRFRRMPKEVILPQLPPITRTRRYLEMSDIQRRCYEEMMEDMVAETESGELLIAANPAVKMLRMVQFSSAAVELVNRNEGIEPGCAFDCYYEGRHPGCVEHSNNLDRVARLIDPSNKLDALMDDLPDLLSAGESVVVFAVSRQLIEMAEKRLQKAKIPYAVIKGNQKQDFRQKQIDDFQEGNVSVILVVISAGGVGITLTRGRIAIFLQRSWSFIDNHQAEGRIHRIGSDIHDSIEIIDYVSRGTVDAAVILVAEGKEIALERIVRDRDAVHRLMRGEVDND